MSAPGHLPSLSSLEDVLRYLQSQLRACLDLALDESPRPNLRNLLHQAIFLAEMLRHLQHLRFDLALDEMPPTASTAPPTNGNT